MVHHTRASEPRRRRPRAGRGSRDRGTACSVTSASTVLLVLSIVLALLARRVFGGHARSGVVSAHLSRGELAFLQSAGDAFVPPRGNALARFGGEAELAAFADEYLSALPPRQRRLIRAMLLFFEHATLLWPARGLGGFARFSSLDAGQRTQWLEGWATSRWPLRRTLFTALRAFVLMGVVAHRENLAHLGLAPWQVVSPIVESDLLYPAIGQPAASIAFTEHDVARVRDTTPLRGAAGPDGEGGT